MKVNYQTTPRKIISLPEEMIVAITAFKSKAKISTESEAIRRLIAMGLNLIGEPYYNNDSKKAQD